MESRLPEGILHEILAFLVPPFCARTFLKFPEDDSKHIPRQPQNRPGAILVSRRWFCIAAPMVYEGVALYTYNHASALARLIKAYPAIGRTVRYLRLEGSSTSRDLSPLARHLKNLHTIYINGHLSPSDCFGRFEGLQFAIPFLRPTTLYVRVAPVCMYFPDNEEDLMLQSIIKPWSSITVVKLSSCSDYSVVDHGWADVLHDLPLLREVHLPASMCNSALHIACWTWRAHWRDNKTGWEWIADRANFEAFVLHGKGDTDKMKSTLALKNLSHIVDKLRFVDEEL